MPVCPVGRECPSYRRKAQPGGYPHTPSTHGHTTTPGATAPRPVPATAPRPKRQARRRQHAAPKLGRRRPAYAAGPKDATSGAHDGSYTQYQRSHNDTECHRTPASARDGASPQAAGPKEAACGAQAWPTAPRLCG